MNPSRAAVWSIDRAEAEPKTGSFSLQGPGTGKGVKDAIQGIPSVTRVIFIRSAKLN